MEELCGGKEGFSGLRFEREKGEGGGGVGEECERELRCVEKIGHLSSQRWGGGQ